MALDGAEHHEPERPFAPYINPTSAKLRRDVPVHEMLLGKGAASKQKLERTAAQLLEEDLRACKRTQPTPRATEELAQRYSERVGQSAKERLIAPRQVSLERAMEDDQQRSSVRASVARPPAAWTLLPHCVASSSPPTCNFSMNVPCLHRARSLAPTVRRR